MLGTLNIPIVHRKGLKADIDTYILEPGEIGYTTDTKELFVGTTGGNLEVLTKLNKSEEIDVLPATLARPLNKNAFLLDGNFRGAIVKGNVTATAVHPFTKGFEGPYTRGSTDTVGAQAVLTGVTFPVELDTTLSQNIALGSKNLVTLSTNITNWYGNESTAKNLADIIDGNKATAGSLNYAVHPTTDANGKHILFDFKSVDYVDGVFKFYNRIHDTISMDRIKNSTVDFLNNDVSVNQQTITSNASEITINAPTGVIFDQVKLTFSGNDQNFREIEIFGKAVYAVDAPTIDGTPTPVSTNAWSVSGLPTGQSAFKSVDTNAWSVSGLQSAFKSGDTIDVTLTMSEALKLPTGNAALAAIKIVIDGKDFVLNTASGKTDASSLTAGKLVFSYTVQDNDDISYANFDIDDASAITLTGVRGWWGRPTPTATSQESATESVPYWYGPYNKGPRANRGGLADGWMGINNGKILKLTKPSGGQHRYANCYQFSLENHIKLNSYVFRAYVWVQTGSLRLGSPLEGDDIIVPSAKQWHPINQLITSSEVTSKHRWSIRLKDEGAQEIYIAMMNIFAVEGEGNNFSLMNVE